MRESLSEQASRDLALASKTKVEEQLLVGPETSNRLSPDLVETINTPALIYDQRKLETLLDRGLTARQRAGCKLLYAVKATALSAVLRQLAPRIDGFSVSSLFEARLIRSLFAGSKIHFTTPGVRSDEVAELSALCEFVSLNSRTQVERYGAEFGRRSSLGIRVNTRISFVADQRYDPCRPSSKLGIPVEEVAEVLTSAPATIEGLHIHTNADSTDFGELLANIQVLIKSLPGWIELKWVNLGGGYLFEDVPLGPLIQAADLVRRRFGAEVFLEPGAGLVRGSGFLVASILDIFDVDGSRIVVLDTTVNHMPEVLEFSYTPDVIGQQEDGLFEYTLVGSTCLAGDVFGTYRLTQPLEVGGKVVFEEAGAYTLAKAHRFNGINLPEVGILNEDGEYRECKAFTYLDYKSYWMTNV